MRLLKLDGRGEPSLTKNYIDDTPPYAILSHTWRADEDEVTFNDIENGSGKSKAGYVKLQFCGEQARKDNLHYFWVDTCCIDKANHTELSEAIASMFRWYQYADKCYVYLSDVSSRDEAKVQDQLAWEPAFRRSRWFLRGWTLQELLAPESVEFFSRETMWLGSKTTLERQIHEATQIPVKALRGSPLTHFSLDERMRWTEERETKRKEDKAYCLMGIFDVFIPLIYGEGDNAFIRLQEEIRRSSRKRKCTVDDEVIQSRERKQLNRSVASLGFRTQDAFVSDNRSDHRHLARIYMQLADHSRLLQQISHSQRLITTSIRGSDVPWNRAAGLLSTSNDAEDRDSQAVDLVLDCVRRFSRDGSLSSIDSLHAICRGSPDYCFESNASFFPERYTMENLFSRQICVNAMIQSPEDHRRQKFFITFAEKPRRWRRIIITATLHTVRNSSAMRQLVLPNDIQQHIRRTLPKAFYRILNDTLPNLQLVHSVTSFSMSLRETESGQLISESRTVPVEDRLEAEMSNEVQKVQDLRDMGCAVISESEVTEQLSISPTCYRVWCRSRTCMEEKVPFATSRSRDNNPFDAFFTDLRLLKSLHGCRGIPEFIGAVLDERGVQLKGFLYESLVIYSLEKLFSMAKSKSELVAWPFREFWARKLIRTVSTVHGRGLYIGAIGLGRIGLNADGTPLFTRLTLSGAGGDMPNNFGHMPPELRKVYETNGRIPRNATNFRTDIFKLGYIL